MAKKQKNRYKFCVGDTLYTERREQVDVLLLLCGGAILAIAAIGGLL